MANKIISSFFSFILQVFFSMIALAGVIGFWACLGQFEIYKKENAEPGIIYVFLILTGSLVAVGIRGVFFIRRGLESDPDIKRLSLRSPLENIYSGMALLVIGVVLTVVSEFWSELFDGHYIVCYGMMIMGAVQALVGASQRAMGK